MADARGEACPRRLKLIACEIAFREICLLAARSRNIVDLEFLPKGLHDLETPQMVRRIQERIDAVDETLYEAALLGYGRCNDGVAGLVARRIPLILPRAHDCITFFLGSKHAYRRYFDENPGTYFRTSGWIERNFVREPDSVMRKLGLDKSYEEYVAQYGPDNAKFIWDSIQSWQDRYEQLVFVDTGTALELRYDERVRREAAAAGWRYEKLEGNLEVLRRLLDGEWDEGSFVVVPPGQMIVARDDERILDCAPVEGDAAAGHGSPARQERRSEQADPQDSQPTDQG